MKEYYIKFKTNYSWLIKEEGWVKSLQGVREAQFALGNGFIGSRAILEEMPHDAKAGTYIAGLYDRIGSQVSEIVNLPNPFNFKITVNGEKLGAMTMDTVEHKRILNLRHGTLYRHSVFSDSKKHKYDYQSLRFLSMCDKNIGVMQVIFTPLDAGVTATIQTGIDTGVYNSGTVTEGRKKHFRIKEVGQFNNAGYLAVETFSKQHTIIFRSGFYYETKGKKIPAEDNIFELKLRKNQTVIFTKIFYINTIPKLLDFEKEKKAAEKKFQKNFKSSFSNLIKKHVNSWEKLWQVAEVSIWGDPEVEKNFRFNIYHMLICANQDGGTSSIGAKALTGEGYRGHIFWDTEIYVLPFYLYVLPDVAKSILLYRYKRLDAARENAKKYGYKGVMFPWESAGIGVDETPGWAKDLDGKIIKIHTGKVEHHITADVAYAFYHYYNITKDETFLIDYGYEVLFETARFWASRVEYNKRKKKYEINCVIGPDEFHVDINNNAFTNIMAKWNLLTAYKLFHQFKKCNTQCCKRLMQKLGITDKEIHQWKKIASNIYVNINKNFIIEQFDGYFKKRNVRIPARDENYLPIITEKLTPRGYSKTQLIKQADVVMLLHLLNDVFNYKTKKANYDYYLDRTL
ncbi:MAG TPA: glycoside hydrolase family 65 protein, partial [Candidatus Omnitrophica bacterium]|nr:glycoside hydrolase family 65 protein [Candidatus Omnitrophota bacterium]